MDEKQLAKYRELLLKEKNNILNNYLSKDIFEIKETTSGDIVDIATDLYETDFFLQLASHDQDTLKSIDNALEKIENGSYGICEATEKPIEEARLDAIPWTRYCFEYAKQLSKKK